MSDLWSLLQETHLILKSQKIYNFTVWWMCKSLHGHNMQMKHIEDVWMCLEAFHWASKRACMEPVSEDLLNAQRREQRLWSHLTAGFWMNQLNYPHKVLFSFNYSHVIQSGWPEHFSHVCMFMCSLMTLAKINQEHWIWFYRNLKWCKALQCECLLKFFF